MSGIVRVNKRENPFAQIDKYPLKDENLSWQEKGLLAYLLSLPNDWDLYINELCKHATNGRDSTAAIVSKLIKKGYIIRERKREKGKFKGYDYQVFERPDLAENWKSVNGKSVNGKTVNEKPETTNNNLTDNNLNNNVSKECVNTQNTPPQEPDEIERPTQDDPIITVTDENKSDKENLRRDSFKTKRSKFIPPTPEQIYEAMFEYEPKKIKNIQLYPDFQQMFDFGMLANKFHNHYTANEWKVGRNKMKDYTATARNWVLSEFGKWIKERKQNTSYGSANNKDARFGAAKISDIEQALFELDQEKREGVFF